MPPLLAVLASPYGYADYSELMPMKVACHLAGLSLCRSALAGDSAAIGEELGNSKVPWKGSYLVDSRRQPAQPLGKRARHPRLDRVVSLILILLLSLGLWAAIWAVASDMIFP